ncbi:MAG: DegT/DnrJ/EryC1/StrS family aminotransferase [Deltaproteobacteria bacterium]|nr:DegT/DnrJ/EryC1/StrS family aminotransferase [Myxococcales bacterium]RZV55535.1 MAG: DegT/DnrJ/EryC1/StrS family aminotransferase [Deltaproteobacteria bacterium]
MRTLIRLAKPWIGEDERRAVADVLESGQLVQGALVERLEQAIAALVGRKHGVAVSSGTSALQLALKALQVGPGDDVLCPALSWPSPAHAVRAAGARVRFIDIDPHEWNSGAEALREARTGSTKAAIVIDQFGNPAHAQEIREALGSLPIIEDAACALGSRFVNGPCGSLGVVSCLSFHPRKILTTGEGGMCLTDDDAIADKLRTLRNHGQLGGEFVVAAGNSRMTEIAAALGLAQLQRLDEILRRRRELAALYAKALDGALEIQLTPDGAESNYQTFGVILPQGFDRKSVCKKLHNRGIEAGVLSFAIHKLVSFAGSDISLPIAEHIASRGIAVPLFPQMRNVDVEEVVRALLGVLDE